MNRLVMVINDGNCKAMRFDGKDLETLRISDLPKDLTETLNKYMVSDQLDFDLRDPELDRSNLEQSRGSLEDKRLKMAEDALSAIAPLIEGEGELLILSSNRFVSKLKQKSEKLNLGLDVIEFVPSGANKGEEHESIISKIRKH